MISRKFYLAHYRDMIPPLLSLMLHGVRVDKEKLKVMKAELKEKRLALRFQLDELVGAHKCKCGLPLTQHEVERVNLREGELTKAGKPRAPKWQERWVVHGTCEGFVPKHESVCGPTAISNKKLIPYLFDKLKFPRNLTGGKVSVNEVTLRKLILLAEKMAGSSIPQSSRAKLPWKRRPKHALKVLKTILELRNVAKQGSFVQPSKIDPDGRIRCQYKFTTRTGRLASSSNPQGRGLNLQNIDRTLRSPFVPDEGCIFLEGDLSQAESRIVYALTGEKELIDLARAPSHEVDAHRINAARIFQCAEAEVTKDQRNLGKRVVHASHYGMGPYRFSEILLNDGIVKSPEECAALIRNYLDARPGIEAWQLWTRKTVRAKRRLVTTWGREITFEERRFDDELYKEAYAFQAQSEIGDLLNQWGLKVMYRMLKKHGLKSKINLQVHDALVISCPKEEVFVVMSLMREGLERPRTYPSIKRDGVELMIPVEFKVGRDWSFKGGHEFKQFPTEEEVRAATAAL